MASLIEVRHFAAIAIAALAMSSTCESRSARTKRTLPNPIQKLKEWYIGTSEEVQPPLVPAVPLYYFRPYPIPNAHQQQQKNFPSIEEIGQLLGTTTKEETLKALGEIASTEDGLYMMANFIKNSLTPSKISIKPIVPSPYPTNPTPFPTNPIPYPENPKPYPESPKPYSEDLRPYPAYPPYSPAEYPQASNIVTEYQPISPEQVEIRNGEPHISYQNAPLQDQSSTGTTFQIDYAKADDTNETRKRWRPSRIRNQNN